MQNTHIDIAVIGGGPGGYATALRASELGLSVILINREERLGGTCLNRGCIPSKALITATRAIHNVSDAKRMGIDASIDSIDFAKLAAFKDNAVKTMTDGLASLLAARKVNVVKGEASIVENHRVRVTTDVANTDNRSADDATVPERTSKNDAQSVNNSNNPDSPDSSSSFEINADNIVIATGSRPRPLPDHPFAGRIIDSTQALDLPRFPKSAVIVGAGAVAVEFASMWNAAGVDVTMLIRHERVLSHMHRRTSIALTRALARNGVHIVTYSHLTDVKNAPNAPDATVSYACDKDENGTEHEVQAEVVLAAIGRDPNTNADWFKDAGIELDEHDLVNTDANGATSQPGIWALGDITQGPALAYRAFEQGIVIAESIAGLNPKPVDNATVPVVVFSTPEFASVGLTLEKAKANPDIHDPKETVYPMMGNARILMSGEPGSMSVVTGSHDDRPDTPVILGVHMLAPDAGDLIAEAEQLVGNRVPLGDAARLIHPHPTFSEAFGEVLLKADGRPLHTR
ncbi:FAD-dependent oxidoreductase [Bifidobacterium sp. ESL0764]|uniref:dihydrolipoyl dehydrogenase family protein n=1 Tax=Bifidobacterium sp. ESL0764 TaxID=2983228 RepID=UPI0023F69C32|nr:FAD-dependent oxidoreductase [Bifidobacterium sp. ESL0764]WEV66468.1 FAD-dependent oxidoreductase [Bifidobacterium sp. ESL0764]